MRRWVSASNASSSSFPCSLFWDFQLLEKITASSLSGCFLGENRFSKDSFFWLQRLAFIAHCSPVYLFHFFSQLPDTFFPQSSHIALELFSPVSSRQVGAFSQTSRHLQSHLAKLSTEPFFTFTITSRLLTVRICLSPFC